MSGDEPKPTLADEAAAWVPPWARDSEPAAEPAAEPGETAGANGSTVDDAAALGAATLDGEPALDSEAATDSEPAVDSEPATGMPLGHRDAEPAYGDDVDVAPDAPGPDLDATANDEAPPLDPGELRGALEAILLVVDEPVGEVTLAQTLEQPVDLVTATLTALAEEYASTARGFELRRAAGGWRLYTRPDFAPYVERFVLDGQQVRLTQASLETLAVVAYKQPVTRSRISAIRGVNCDGVIRTLVSRGLIEECGTEPETGAYLYRTTSLFLEKLGMDSVGELPPLAPFLPDDVDEIADAPR